MVQIPSLQFAATNQSPNRYDVTVTVPEVLVRVFYKEAINAQQYEASTYGFSKGLTPVSYIEHNFKPNLITHVQEFLFHYFVLSFLYQNIYIHKLVLAADPNLATIEVTPTGNVLFHFILETVTLELYEWEDLIFKAPPRKNYKDIDRQVASFIKQEEQLAQEYEPVIAIGDWICFDVALVSADRNPLFGEYAERLWLKIGDEEVDKEFQEIFMGKRIHEPFYTKAHSLQEYFSDYIDTHYLFLITVQHIVPYRFFSLDYLKHHFMLKKPKDVSRKLIEVFSYRNDMSQRRETIEAVSKLLLTYHQFEIPDYLLEHHQQRVLEAVHNNPDYLVYKAQNDFKKTVRRLAEKQAREAVLMDHIAYSRGLDADINDVCAYLAFTHRPRMKEFIYFDHPTTKKLGQEMPISHFMVRHSCLREKTLNHVIHTLAARR